MNRIVEHYPDISVITVSVVLNRLCDEGFICKTGNGRIVGDALYACSPVMRICRANGWEFVLTFREGRSPNACGFAATRWRSRRSAAEPLSGETRISGRPRPAAKPCRAHHLEWLDAAFPVAVGRKYMV